MRKKATTCRFEVSNQNANGSISHRKVPPSPKRGSGNVKVEGTRKKAACAKIEAKTNVSQGRVVVDLPIRTVSEANCFEPWRKKYARHKDQQRAVFVALNPLWNEIKLPCRIMLTRFAPDELDTFDNLPMSFKYIVDAVCAIIMGDHRAGKADSDKRISIACNQVHSRAYGIRIEITYD